MRPASLAVLASVLFLLALHGPAVGESGYGISYTEYCTATGIDVRLGWGPGNPYGGDVYVDVSLENAHWSDGTYITYGPVPGAARGTVVPNLQPDVTYYVRIVSQQTDARWYALEGLSFKTAPACSYDGSSRQPQMASPGSQLLSQFQGGALASASTAGAVHVSAFPHVSAGPDNCPPYQTCSGIFTPGQRLASIGNNQTSSPSPNPNPNPNPGGCHPSYTGYCVTDNGQDWDCTGDGNGPNYIPEGVVVGIVGPDVYGLDGNGNNPRDNDNLGCNREP